MPINSNSNRKTLVRVLPLAFSALVFASGCFSAEEGLPSSLIDRPAVGDLGVYGSMARKALIAAPGIPGQSAVRIDIPTPGVDSHPWEISVGAVTTADIHKGDRVVAAFWARAELATGQLVARMQSNDAPYSGIAQADIVPTQTWQLFQLEGVAGQAYPAGHTGMTLSLNTKRQILDVGPVYIFKNPAPSGNLQKLVSAIPLGGASRSYSW